MKSDYLEVEEFKRVKTFMYSMNLFELTPAERKVYLRDKRITQNEKQIIECTLILKDSQFKSIISKLSLLNTTNVLVESQRLLILGIAYCASGQLTLSRDHLLRACTIFKKYSIHKYEFYALLHLFYVHYNIKDVTSMARVLDEMTEMKPSHSKDQISLMRCQFSFYTFTEDYQKAKKTLQKIELEKKQMHPGQLASHLIDVFVYYLKTDQFSNCEMTLKEMTKSRLFYHSANYNFIKALFNHFYHNAPIYIYENDFKDIPLLYHQLHCIKALEASDRSEVEKSWHELSLIAPNVYSQNLKYNGDKCLFSLCLERYTKSAPVKETLIISGTREEQLVHILKDSNVPISKEWIYQKLWGQEAQDKSSFIKLSMMISRIKRKTGLNIISRKGCYLISTSEKKASA